MKIEDALTELYGLPPGDFIVARNKLAKSAKADGDAALAKSISALKKPTLGAWLVNTMVRELAGEMDQLLALGEQFREAQAEFAGDELRALDKQRRQLVSSLVSQGRILGRPLGHKISEQTARDVENTLRAALADATAAQAVRTGALLDTFTSSGVEPISLEGLVAVPLTAEASSQLTPATSKPAKKPAGPSKELQAARETLNKTRAELVDAEAIREETAGASSDAEAAHAEAAERVRRLRAELRDAERDETMTAREAQSAAKEAGKAQRGHDAATRAVQRASSRVEELS